MSKYALIRRTTCRGESVCRDCTCSVDRRHPREGNASHLDAVEGLAALCDLLVRHAGDLGDLDVEVAAEGAGNRSSRWSAGPRRSPLLSLPCCTFFAHTCAVQQRKVSAQRLHDRLCDDTVASRSVCAACAAGSAWESFPTAAAEKLSSNNDRAHLIVFLRGCLVFVV